MRLLLVGCLLLAATAYGDTIPFEERPYEALANRDLGMVGQIALGIRQNDWHHGESPHFVIHFRRVTEAKRVALEIEYNLAYVARALGAGPERYARKSHVFVFEDEADWKTFLSKAPVPPWAGSFAVRDELFLSVRAGQTGLFDSQTLAHETTHAVVARLYPGKRWPLWLSEGFAEQMSGESVGARMGQYNPRLLQRFRVANLPLEQMTAMTVYPPDPVDVARLYQSSERLVRLLTANQPPGRFPQLVDALASGEPTETAIPRIYGYPTYADFARRYNQMP